LGVGWLTFDRAIETSVKQTVTGLERVKLGSSEGFSSLSGQKSKSSIFWCLQWVKRCGLFADGQACKQLDIWESAMAACDCSCLDQLLAIW
jgi:hypothetical protein